MAKRLNFIIVGASVAGLAAAIALKKAGHEILVLEREDRLGDGRKFPQRVRSAVPPNGSKILYDWGLHEKIKALDYPAEVPGTSFFSAHRFEGTGPNHARDLMGYQTYTDELLSEARGNYLIIRYSDLVGILYDELQRPLPPGRSDASFDKSKVFVHFNAEVCSVDLDQSAVTLRNGERLQADAIIGADGPLGVVRAALQAEAEKSRKKRQPSIPEEDFSPDDAAPKYPPILSTPLWYYGGIVPREVARQVSSADLDSYSKHGMCAFFGNDRCAVVLSLGRDEISVNIFTTDAGRTRLGEVLGEECDAGLRQIVDLADANTQCPTAVTHSGKYEQLESWVSESGRVAILGKAAHPFSPGAVQTYASALEDGLFLGKIFSHTDDPTRIPEFLHAFQEHREPRTSFLKHIEEKYVVGLTTPNGPMQQMRDAMFRMNHARGAPILHAPEIPSMEAEAIEETSIVFGYDADEDAEEWWVTWGRFHDFASTS
ncbi:FAD-binding-3 domain-containing protein [Mycena chlorophos]|uniref:FAD-binding-3 domain-containing protein n=1 Tax=Mycena chlorophos TaxID=658473 RepID=A0A8H6SZI1_MYCCL|nr:FAD-binding-3 domain-containing protein [Mycena chlorophos]